MKSGILEREREPSPSQLIDEKIAGLGGIQNVIETLESSHANVSLSNKQAALDVGLFEVRYPWSEIFDTRHFEDCQKIVTALFDLQATWVDWMNDAAAGPGGRTWGGTRTGRRWWSRWGSPCFARCFPGGAAW